MKVSVVIPCWNGKKLLEKNLPAVLAIGSDEVIIVDDFSSDDSVKFLKDNYPQIKLLEHKKNLGFGKTCNDGVSKAKGEIIILLNQDVRPDKELLKYTLSHFSDQKIFAVSFNEKTWSWGKIFWKNGFVEHKPGQITKNVHISAWASGASAAFRKSIWLKLEGFDSVFYPFYWEDVDLGYRAWKYGYKIIWEPKAVVEHKHGETIGKSFSQDYINFVSTRNQLIFIWKNITQTKFILDHWFNLGKLILRKPGYLKVVFAAMSRFPAIITRWIKIRLNQKVSDNDIFSYFK